MLLFIENMIKLYEESGKVNYRKRLFFIKIYRTRYLSQCRNHSPEQKINHKINLGRSALRFNVFNLAIFMHQKNFHHLKAYSKLSSKLCLFFTQGVTEPAKLNW